MSIQIHEIKNEKIKLRSMKMLTNAPIPGNEGRIFERYNFSLLVCGSPGSGKTTLILSQLTNPGGLFYKKFNKVYIFSPSLNTVEKKIELPSEQIFDSFDIEILQDIISEQKENLTNTEELPDEILIIFDDMMTEISKDNSKIFTKMIMNRRHLHISVICICQVFNKIKAHIRKGFSDTILLNTNNKKELESIRDELTNFDKHEWRDIIKYCFKSPHDFILLRNTGEIFRNFNKLQIKEIDD
jgi:GTPase SAR1 family protein